MLRHADKRQRAIPLEQGREGIEVMRSSDRVEDLVEAVGVLRVAAQRMARRICRGAVIGPHHAVVTISLQPIGAGVAMLAAVDHAAHAHRIADTDPVTSRPTAVTWPTISCPGTHGYCVPALSDLCRFDWFSPGQAVWKQHLACGLTADLLSFPRPPDHERAVQSLCPPP